MADKQTVPAAEVRSWARQKGFPVGNRGHLDRSVISAFNKAHRVRQFESKNPSDGYVVPSWVDTPAYQDR